MKATSYFAEQWERLSPLIQQALDRAGNTHSLDDVKKLVLSGKAQFWPGRNSVGVTEIVDTPNYRILNGWLAAGELEEVIDMTNRAAEWGRASGCEIFTLSGRKGWVRVMAKHDFKFRHITLERRL